MASPTITVLARITAQRGQSEALARTLQKLLAASRQEPGCISYQLMQNTANPCDFNTIEQWRDSAAIAAHMQSAHVQSAVAAAAPLLAEAPDIRQYTITG